MWHVWCHTVFRGPVPPSVRGGLWSAAWPRHATSKNRSFKARQLLPGCFSPQNFLSGDFPSGPVIKDSELPSTAGGAGSIPGQGTKIPAILPSMAKTTKQTKKHSLWRSELPNKPAGPKDIAEAEKEKERCWRSPRCRVRTRLQARGFSLSANFLGNFPPKKACYQGK